MQTLRVETIGNHIRDYRHPMPGELEALSLNTDDNWLYIGRSETITGTKSPLHNPNYAGNLPPGSTLKAYKKHLFDAIRNPDASHKNYNILWTLQHTINDKTLLLCHCKNATTCHGSIVIKAHEWLMSPSGEKYRLREDGRKPPQSKIVRIAKPQHKTQEEIKARIAELGKIEEENRKAKRTTKRPFLPGDLAYFVAFGKTRITVRVESITYMKAPQPIGAQQYTVDPEDRGLIEYDYIDQETGQAKPAHRDRIAHTTIMNPALGFSVDWGDWHKFGSLEMHKPKSVHRYTPRTDDSGKTEQFRAEKSKEPPINWDKLEAAAQARQEALDVYFMEEAHETSPEPNEPAPKMNMEEWNQIQERLDVYMEKAHEEEWKQAYTHAAATADKYN
jgi:hypothetical protein